jgi:hypothetical protein
MPGPRPPDDRSPWAGPFPPRPPPEVTFLCSVASSVLWPSPTSHPRACSAYGFRLPEPARTEVRARVRSPRFRTKDFSTRMGSPTAQGPSRTRHHSREMMLPSPQQKKISTLEELVSQLNTQLMVSPVNASRQPSRTVAHHSGPERLARPYSAVDFHLLSFASLSWRSPILAEGAISGPFRAKNFREFLRMRNDAG